MTYPNSPGYKGTLETGRDGARYYAPQRKRRQDQVLDALVEGPATAEEIGERIDLHWYLVRPRLSEAKAQGLAVDTGARKPSALGGKVAVYRLATADERAAFEAAKSRGADDE